jgi:hypothetical protein
MNPSRSRRTRPGRAPIATLLIFPAACPVVVMSSSSANVVSRRKQCRRRFGHAGRKIGGERRYRQAQCRQCRCAQQKTLHLVGFPEKEVAPHRQWSTHSEVECCCSSATRLELHRCVVCVTADAVREDRSEMKEVTVLQWFLSLITDRKWVICRFNDAIRAPRHLGAPEI